MKEATGELNMTVITVVAIVAVGAFFTAIIWPRIRNSISNSTKCADAYCPSSGCTNGVCKCTYIDPATQETEEVTCKAENDVTDTGTGTGGQ